MEHPDGVRASFIASAGHWVRQLRHGGAKPGDDEAGPRELVNLSHHLSDTLPTPLAERVEAFVDEFWTLCETRWPADGVAAPALSDEFGLRVEALARTWGRLERDLAND